MSSHHNKALCADCGKVFRLTRQWRKYCSDRCRYRAWVRTHPRVALPLKGVRT